MSIYPQFLLDVYDELIVDLFAGGGGASVGIEMATGRQVDVAINHDPDAVSLHRANHPQTRHLTSDVFEVDPRAVAQGRPIGLLWASPDCTFYSKARGGKPIRSEEKKRRALAWVVTRWAGQVQPRVIILENVEEFADWGPLVARRDRKTGRVKKRDGTVAEPGERVPVEDQSLVPCPDRSGKRFRAWIRSLKDHGYDVEWKELRACDFGAPTIRKRLFLIARCDGEPIVWPEPSHGPGTGRTYRTAAECIDWTEPMCSIFATPEEAKQWGRDMRERGHRVGTPRRPLAENTMARIARGVKRYVLDNPEPFIVANNAHNVPRGIDEPLATVTGGGRHILVAPSLAQTGYGERDGQDPRSLDLHEPLGTIVGAGQKHALIAAYLAKHFTGVDGVELDQPAPTVTTIDHNSLVAASLAKLRGTSSDADPEEPLHTVSAGGNHHGLVTAHLTHFQSGDPNGGDGDLEEPLRTVLQKTKAGLVYAFLTKYYGEGVGQEIDAPAPTVTTKDRMGLVTVHVEGEPFIIVDIALRMLQPRELYRAQGFPDSYRIERGADGQRLTKTIQVRMVGNSVPPPVAASLVKSNVPSLIARDEALAGVA